MKKTFLLITLCIITTLDLLASPSISGGVWMNYRYNTTPNSAAAERDKTTLGDTQGEALVLYFSHDDEKTAWDFSGEARFGPGAFTDTANNSGGDNFALHKLWIGYRIASDTKLYIGKSAVPFGWKTVNFWPGDMFLAGYGDQMDVGLKLSSQSDALHYDFAYFHADDWGETSTDTTDDNRHWGSSTTYRKVQTFVGNIAYSFEKAGTLGLSAQYGKLQDLNDSRCTASSCDTLKGDHHATTLYYTLLLGDFSLKTQYLNTSREVPFTNHTLKTTRYAFEGSYQINQWLLYTDIMHAKSNTKSRNQPNAMAYSLGGRYHYGPGWIYLEYLTQDGWFDRDADLHKGDFESLYLSIDYYF